MRSALSCKTILLLVTSFVVDGVWGSIDDNYRNRDRLLQSSFTSEISTMVIRLNDTVINGTVLNGGDRVVGRMDTFSPMTQLNMGVAPEKTSSSNATLSTYIGIKVRGHSTAGLPKKQYSVKTYTNPEGDKQDVELYGMPEENNWIINGPMIDRTLMRNVLGYELAGRTNRYSSRHHYFELFLVLDDATSEGRLSYEDNYVGVYYAAEKIKRDSVRVDISKNKEDNVSGGYLFKIDRQDPDEYSFNTPWFKVVVDYPELEDMTPEQQIYLEGYVETAGNAIDSSSYDDQSAPEFYGNFIDIGSFVDYFLVNEIALDPDGYVASTYMHKDKDDIIHAGPVWDFNIAFGWNSGNTNISAPTQWLYQTKPALGTWYTRLMTDVNYRYTTAWRWAELREDVWSNREITALISTIRNNEITEAAFARNSDRWTSNIAQVDDLLAWVLSRVEWMDKELSQYLRKGELLDAACWDNEPCPSAAPSSNPPPVVVSTLCGECSETEPCEYVETCGAQGMSGCNARGQVNCRFCGFANFTTCSDGRGAPSATPSTVTPDGIPLSPPSVAPSPVVPASDVTAAPTALPTMYPISPLVGADLQDRDINTTFTPTPAPTMLRTSSGANMSRGAFLMGFLFLMASALM